MTEQEEFEFRLRLEREQSAPAQSTAPTARGKDSSALGDFAAGAVRGAGSIGATLLAPVDAAARAMGVQNDYIGRNDRRESMTQALGDALGFDTDSTAFGVGKLTGEVAGTAGAGGVLANGVRAAGNARALTGLEPIVQGVARGLETGGFRVGPLAGTGLGTATRAATGVATGGAAAGMVSPSDAPMGAAIGGVLPGAVQLAGQAGGAIRRAVAGEVAPEVRALASRAAELGIQVPADRLVNSRPMNAVASSLNYVPMSGRAATEDRMVSQLNTALSRTFGQDSSNVTMALRKADDVLGGKFDNFLRSNTVKFTSEFDRALNEAAQQASDELGSEGASIIKRQIEGIRAKVGPSGEIDGQAAYNIKKTLDRIGNRNSPEAWYALDLKGRLMDALNASVGQQKAQEFAKLRKEYGNMLALQKIAKNGAEGEVSAARLANLPNIRNDDVQELADIAAQFVKGREGQHGAAQRVYGAGGAMTAAGLGALGVPMAPALALGAGTVMTGGRAVNGLLNSQMARNFVLGGRGLLGEPEPLGLLTQAGYRSLPLLPAQ